MTVVVRAGFVSVRVRGNDGRVASEIVLPHSPRYLTVESLRAAAVDDPIRVLGGLPATVAVVGGHAGAGASTLALAVVDAADGASAGDETSAVMIRLIDASAPPWSGLANATIRDTAVIDGWRRGSRGRRTLVDRVHSSVEQIAEVPEFARNPDELAVGLRVVDVGWSARELLGAGDSVDRLLRADRIVLVSRCSERAVAQTEHALSRLDRERVVLVLVGGRRGRVAEVPGAIHARAVIDRGDVVEVPLLPRRVVGEITPTRSPARLLMAARQVLDLVPAGDTRSVRRSPLRHGATGEDES